MSTLKDLIKISYMNKLSCFRDYVIQQGVFHNENQTFLKQKYLGKWSFFRKI